MGPAGPPGPCCPHVPPLFSPQLETAKKAYHLACKEEKLAMTREANSKADQSNTPEQQKKLQDKVEKCKQDVQKVRASSATGQLSSGLTQHRAPEMAICSPFMAICSPFIPIYGLLFPFMTIYSLILVPVRLHKKCLGCASRAEICPSCWGEISPSARLILPCGGFWGAGVTGAPPLHLADSGEVREGAG